MKVREVVLMLIKLVWLLFCCYALIYFFIDDKAYVDSEVSELYYLKMLALTFPLGYIVNLITSILILPIQWIFKASNYSNYLNTLILWFAMVGAGYIQWFVVVPLMFNKLLEKLEIFRKKT